MKNKAGRIHRTFLIKEEIFRKLKIQAAILNKPYSKIIEDLVAQYLGKNN